MRTTRHRRWIAKFSAWRSRRRTRRAAPAYTTPSMLPVWIVLPVALAAAMAGAWGINAWLRGQADLIGENPDPLAVTRVVLTLVGGVGAVFVGVYAYRKQRIEEAASLRADHDQFLTRYNSATEQLSHVSAAARLAGAYAMAQLADDWAPREGETVASSRRQQCVDVLCAYLRMPPRDDPGDTEVRATVLTIIADHISKPLGDYKSWSPLAFDFSRAEFNDLYLGGTFTGPVMFSMAKFHGTTFFQELEFQGPAFFYNSRFSHFLATDGVHFGGLTRFSGSEFEDPAAFDDVTFGGLADFEAVHFKAAVSFHACKFAGAWTNFKKTRFEEGANFVSSTFEGNGTIFADTTFEGKVNFSRATFSSSIVDFKGATFRGGSATFEGCELGSDTVVDDRAVFAPECERPGWEDLIPLPTGASTDSDG